MKNQKSTLDGWAEVTSPLTHQDSRLWMTINIASTVQTFLLGVRLLWHIYILHHTERKKKQTTVLNNICLVMRFSAGTRGVIEHTYRRVMTWLTPPNSINKYVPNVNDTMSRTLKVQTSVRKYQALIKHFLWDMEILKMYFEIYQQLLGDFKMINSKPDHFLYLWKLYKFKV